MTTPPNTVPPTIRGYQNGAPPQSSDAFIVDRLGVGTLYYTVGDLPGSGTVTKIVAGTGLTGGTIVQTGTIALAIPVSVADGGTGDTTLATHSVLLGAGTSAVTHAAPSTAGQPLVSNGASSDPSFQTLPATGGGTGAASLTAHAVLLGEGTSPMGFAGPDATVGKVLTSNGSSSDPSFQFLPGAIPFVFNGGGSPIATGTYIGYAQIPFACTITGATMVADVSTSTVVDIWIAAFSTSSLPVIGNSIVASAPPTITATLGSTDTTLTGWTKTIAAGSTILFHVNSNNNATQLSLVLAVLK